MDVMARGSGDVASAWTNKGDEALLKSKIAFRGDDNTLSILHEFEVKLKSAKRKSKMSGLIWLVALIAALAGLSAIAFLY